MVLSSYLHRFVQGPKWGDERICSKDLGYVDAGGGEKFAGSAKEGLRESRHSSFTSDSFACKCGDFVTRHRRPHRLAAERHGAMMRYISDVSDVITLHGT